MVGGLGVGATVHYYQALTQAHRQLGRSPDIVITHAETSRVFEYVQTGDRDGLADYLLGFIRRMHSAGTELAAIPAVTPHFCIRELLAQSPVPLIDLFQPLKQELARRKLKRVAIFGTRFVIESALFGLVPEIEIISPHPEEIEQIHGIYSELAQSGNGTVDQHSQLTFIARDLCSREKV